MPGAVKTYRQQQAAQTRHRIAAAARRLFAEQGYAATSIDAVASAAGVAPRTVYAAFGTKREILSTICEDWLAEADAAGRAQRVLAEPDPLQRLRGAGEWLANLYTTGLDVATVFEGATDTDEQTRALLRSKLAGRDQVLDAMVATVGDLLPSGVPTAQAVLRALAAPGVYRALVVDAGWTPQAFAAWVSSVLAGRTG